MKIIKNKLTYKGRHRALKLLHTILYTYINMYIGIVRVFVYALSPTPTVPIFYFYFPLHQ